MSNGFAWSCLILSGVADVAWAVATKASEGYSRPWWTLASLVALAVFLGLLSQSLKTLPLGTAYVVWTGIGAMGSVAAGVILFGESMTAARLLAMAVVIAGIAALRILPE